MLLGLIYLFIGFPLLIKGADWLVDGASALAKKAKISDLVIGLTIVAFGTSAPELVVNIISSLQGNTEIAIGNILGSNIANVLLILGIAAIIFPLKVTKATIWKEIPLSLLAALVLGLTANDFLIDHQTNSVLTRIDGLIFISFFIIFLYYAFSSAKTNGEDNVTQETKSMASWLMTLLIIVGITGLTLGGKLVVDGAVKLATTWGISTSLIGLTVVAIGTSLPELATSAVAAYKRNADIAVGNVVGSNIFNIFWILGISATIKPLPFQLRSNLDVIMVIVASLLLFTFMFVGRKHVIERWQGIFFVAIYLTYLVLIIIQG